MRVFVTGATGFIGSHVADRLIAKSYEVVCLTRKNSSLRWLENKSVELCNVSLHDRNGLEKALENIDYVYHIGGAIAGKTEKDFYENNVASTRNLLEAAAKHGTSLKRFVYMSSQAAGGPADSLDKPSTEDMAKHPMTAYGRSKSLAEDIVHDFADRIPVTIIRPPAVYGPRDSAILDIFKIVNYGIAPLMGFDTKYISLIHGEDLAGGTIQAAEADAAIGQTYYVSSDKCYTWDEMMDCIAGAMNKKIIKLRIPHSIVLGIASISGLIGKFSTKPAVFNYEKGIDFIQKYWICSNQKAKNDFGFEEQIPLDEGIKQTALWYKENNWI